MIHKLRNKITIVITAICAGVIIACLSVILVFEYNQELSLVESVLDKKIDDTARYVQFRSDTQSNNFLDASHSPNNDSNNNAHAENTYTPPNIGKGNITNESSIATICFILSDDGKLYLPEGVYSSANLSQDLLDSISSKLVRSASSMYKLTEYGLVYKVEQRDDYTTYVAFADISEVSQWERLALLLIPIGLIAIAVLFWISTQLSKWLIKPVKAALEQQKQFVADASHDLKTPLAVMMANNSILLTHGDKTLNSQMQWIESNQREASKMLELVNNMLTLARLDNEERMQKSNNIADVINFSELVEGEVLAFESIAFDKQLSFKTEITPKLHISGSKTYITVLVNTLIENAFKHAAVDDVVSVILCQSSNFNYVEFRVSNKLTHIEKNDLEHIFDRFYRPDKSRVQKVNSSEQQSHGLGLAIAYSIAQNNGGELTVESPHGKGTTFIAKFPIYKK